MGNYLGQEIPNYYQTRAMTGDIVNQLNNIPYSNSLQPPTATSIWNSNTTTTPAVSNYNESLYSYSNSIMNDLNATPQATPLPFTPVPAQANQYISSINKASEALNAEINATPQATPLPFTPVPAQTNQYISSINKASEALNTEINKPMNIPQTDPFMPAMVAQNNSVSNTLDMQTQRMLAQINSPTLAAPPPANQVTTPNVSGTPTGTQQVDPATGQPVNNDAATQMAEKYNKVATIINDPRQNAKLQMLSEQLKDCLKEGPFKDRDEVKQIISQLKPEELASLEIVYGQKNGSPTKLREDLRHHFAWLSPGRKAPEEVEALNKAALTSPSNAVLALKDAMNGSFGNIDKDTLNQIISSSNDPTFLSQVSMEYQQAVGKSLASELKNKLWWAGGDNNNLVEKVTNAMLKDKTQSGLM